MSAAPALSVIVLARVSDPQLAATVASVREQRHVAPEVITIERLASTPAALNAGLAAAQGEWVLFLEGGDRFVGDLVLSEALNWMRRTEAGVAAGEAAYDTGHLVKLRSQVNPCARDFLPHPATFYRRALFAENGGFEEAFELKARYELHARLWKNRVRFKPMPLRIAAARAPEKLTWRGWREEAHIRRRYFGFWRRAGWNAWSLLRWAGRQL